MAETVQQIQDDIDKLRTINLDLYTDLSAILGTDYNLANFKFDYIETSKNVQVDNPGLKINLNGQNVLIKGIVGTGKTTFFDKLMHPFIFPESEETYIEGISNNITLKLSNDEEDLGFTFRSKAGIDRFKVDDHTEEESISILKNYCLIQNEMMKFLFIGENADNFNPFESYINKVDSLRKFFTSPKIIELISILTNYHKKKKQDINELRKDLENTKLSKSFFENEITRVKNEYEEIEEFLNNEDKIRESINNIKDQISANNEIIELFDKKKNVEEILENLKKKQRYAQLLETKVQVQIEEKKNNWIKEKYFSETPVCPVCLEPVDFVDFSSSLKRDYCFLCKNNRYEYVRDEKKEDEDFKGSFFQYSLEISKYEEEKLKIEDEIAEKTNIEISDPVLFRYLGKKAKEISNPKFNIDAEFHARKEKYTLYKELLKQKYIEQKSIEANIERSEKRLEENESNLSNIENIINHIKHLTINKSKSVLDDFEKDVRKYWDQLTHDKIKTFAIKDNHIFIVSFSPKGVSRPTLITKLTQLKKMRASSSQLNVLRYALQLALIKNMYISNANHIPLKSIIIDDPDPKIIGPLVSLLINEFSNELGFQLIILTSPNLAEQITNFKGKTKLLLKNKLNALKTQSSFEDFLSNFKLKNTGADSENEKKDD